MSPPQRESRITHESSLRGAAYRRRRSRREERERERRNPSSDKTIRARGGVGVGAWPFDNYATRKFTVSMKQLAGASAGARPAIFDGHRGSRELCFRARER